MYSFAFVSGLSVGVRPKRRRIELSHNHLAYVYWLACVSDREKDMYTLDQGLTCTISLVLSEGEKSIERTDKHEHNPLLKIRPREDPSNRACRDYEDILIRRERKEYMPPSYEYDGKNLTLIKWSEITNISYNNLNSRLRMGWSVKRTLSTPVHIKLTEEEKKNRKRESRQRYYKKNKEYIDAVNKKWVENNKDKFLACRRAYNKTTQRKLLLAKIYQENKEELIPVMRDRIRNLRRQNKEKYREINRRAYLKVKEDPQTIKYHRIRVRLNSFLKGKCNEFEELCGATRPELIEYISSLFEPGMLWERRSEFAVAFIRRPKEFDLFDPEQVKQLCHYTNLRPEWRRKK